MKNQAERLEQALRLWEDSCFLFGKCAELDRLGVKILEEGIPALNPFFHWHEFRDYLLSDQSRVFNSGRFEATDESGERVLMEHLSAYTCLPLALWCWNKHSRRIFRVSEELQTLLNLTSLDGMAWSDIPWPFESFAVTLDAPLALPRGGHLPDARFDTIIVYTHFVPVGDGTGLKKLIRFLLLDSELGNRVPLSRFDREEIDGLLSKAKQKFFQGESAKKLMGRIEAVAWGVSEVQGSTFYLDCSGADGLKIGETVGHVKQRSRIFMPCTDDQYLHWEAAARIVAGLCLYLTTLPPKTPHRSDWTPADPGIKRPDPRVITTGAEVCLVSSVYKLNAEEREVIERIGSRNYHELGVHFRIGHWRRKPGFGHDPAAKKVVHVRPTLVRRDRLPENAVPGGSANILGA
ncbi:MAG: hypothetical protein HY434_00390 [Candidatus Liptonbacteria bacterium]|nr:hypothetical protein [Candidatus Liptonbacteria bacterium]